MLVTLTPPRDGAVRTLAHEVPLRHTGVTLAVFDLTTRGPVTSQTAAAAAQAALLALPEPWSAHVAVRERVPPPAQDFEVLDFKGWRRLVLEMTQRPDLPRGDEEVWRRLTWWLGEQPHFLQPAGVLQPHRRGLAAVSTGHFALLHRALVD